MIHINTNQYSHMFLSNELAFKQYMYYYKKKTTWFNTKIGLSSQIVSLYFIRFVIFFWVEFGESE